jgi:hypothetical protein
VSSKEKALIATLTGLFRIIEGLYHILNFPERIMFGAVWSIGWQNTGESHYHSIPNQKKLKPDEV